MRISDWSSDVCSSDLATLADGRRVTRSLAVAPRGWDISRLGSLPKYPVPSATFQRLRPPELAQIKAARATDHDSDGWRQRFVWPAPGRISTNFGSQRIDRKSTRLNSSH